MLKKLLPDTFILALVATLLAATFFPASGVAAEVVSTLAGAAVVVLFFFVGCKLPSRAILDAVIHWRLHAVILASTFVAFPIMILGLHKIVPTVLDPALWTGFFFLAVLPSTVQSSIALTSIARGNVASAVASASVSQVLGVFITPVLFGLIVGSSVTATTQGNFGKIAMQILLPFIIGHLSRPLLKDWVERYKKYIGLTDRLTILLAVFSAFSSAVLEGIWQRLPPRSLLAVVAMSCIVLGLALALTALAARVCGFPIGDRIAVIFCGTKKSLVQGVPMARVMFSGPDAGLILLPIMIFHQLQLMICSAIARKFAMRDDENA